MWPLILGCWFRKVVEKQGWAMLLLPQGPAQVSTKKTIPVCPEHVLYTTGLVLRALNMYLISFNSPEKPEYCPILQKTINVK